MYNPAERRPTVTTPVSQVKTGTARRCLIMAWLGNRPWIDDEENPLYAREDVETEAEDDDDEDGDDFEDDADEDEPDDELEDDDDLVDDDEVDEGGEEDEGDDADDK